MDAESLQPRLMSSPSGRPAAAVDGWGYSLHPARVARLHPALDPSTLTTCAEERIHEPGRVQSHGALVATDVGGRVLAASENIRELGAVDAKQLIDQPLHRFVELSQGSSEALFEHRPGALDPFDLQFAGRPLTGLRHRNPQGLLIFEFEPPTSRQHHVSALLGAHELVQRVVDARDSEALLLAAVTAARAISGFDRAMVYRFHRDDHGEVIAEDRAAGLEPFLGLHYPASDIPEQARRLYTHNRIRCIANVDATPTPIRVGVATPVPLDLSKSWLRAVSPLHVAYLRNMGVGSSASVSLMRDGKLWGLIALHHRTPRVVSFDTRLALDLLGRVMSAQLDLRETAFEQARLREAHQSMTALLDSVRVHERLAPSLVERTPNIMGLIHSARGAAVLHGADCECVGKTPPKAVVRALARYLRTHEQDSLIELGTLSALPDVPEIDPSVAAGLLAVPLSRARPDYLMWFKPAASTSVRWAGRPDAGVKRTDADPNARLQPRASFAEYIETVQGKALEWEDWERASAEVIGLAIGNIAQRLDEVAAAVERSASAESRFQAVVDANPHPMILLERSSGTIRLVNPAFIRLFGEDELVHSPIERLIPEATEEALHQLAAAPLQWMWEIHTPSSGLRIVNPSAAPLELDGREMVLLTLVDDTARVLAERALRDHAAALEEANKELDGFVYVASHDLKAPLRGIRQLATWLEEDALEHLPETSRRHLSRIRNRIDRMERLFADLLAYSRAGRVRQLAELTRVEAVARDAFELAIGERPGFRLRVDAPDLALPLVRAELETSLRNLVGNAVKHHDGDEGLVAIRAWTSGDRLIVEVQDDGPGIPEHQTEAVFEMFTTLDPRDRVEGSGMGLAITRRIVESSGGQVSCRPGKPRGTVFRFDLALRDEEAHQPAHEETA